MLRGILKQARILPQTRCRGWRVRMRVKLENYADWLAYGDKEEETTLPQIYQDANREFQSLESALPETLKEENWLAEQREQVYADIEEDRLKYFDSKFGTNTYFRRVGTLEERYSVDFILQNKKRRYHQFVTEVKLSDIVVEDNVEAPQREFLRAGSTESDKLEYLEKQMLPSKPIRHTNTLGRTVIDYFGYLNPSIIERNQVELATQFLMNEAERFEFKLNDTGIHRRVQKDLMQALDESHFDDELPLIRKRFVYKIGPDYASIFRMRRKPGISENEKFEREEFDFDEEVISFNELRLYFFNFKDQLSFHLCRFLKNNEIDNSHILGYRVDENDQYLILGLKLGSKYITIVKDISMGLYLDFYFISDSNLKVEIGRDEGNTATIYCCAKDIAQDSWVLSAIKLSELNWITPIVSTMSKELSSVVKHIKDNESSLLLNSAGIAGPLKEIWRTLGLESKVSLVLSGPHLNITRMTSSPLQCEIFEISDLAIRPIYTSSETYLLQTSENFKTCKKVKNQDFSELEDYWSEYSIKEFGVLEDYTFAIVDGGEEDFLIYRFKNRDSHYEVKFGQYAHIELTTAHDYKGSSIFLTCSYINKPRVHCMVNLPTQQIIDLKMEHLKGISDLDDIASEKYDYDSDLIDINLLYLKSNVNPKSPIILWLSDKKNFDTLEPTLLPLLQRDCVLAMASIKDATTMNMKNIIEQFSAFAYHFATTSPSEKISVVGEGPISGLIALSSYIKYRGVFHSGIFISPICDLEEFLDNSPYKFGYIDLETDEGYQDMLSDSPYHREDLKYMSNSLFISSHHSIGYQALKLFAKSKYLTKKESDNYLIQTKGDIVEDRGFWMSYLIDSLYMRKRYRGEKMFKSEEYLDEGFGSMPQDQK